MAEGKTIFIDTTKCTACRGCQVACKQWNRRQAEKTENKGSHQNPPDLSFNTWKLVRFSEVAGPGVKWYFFPDQCRHCISPPCKEVADYKAKGAIIQDEDTGAVIFNPKVKVTKEVFKEIQDVCPYNIPRISPEGVMVKCTMCIDRVKSGMLPACVKACPTGAMGFGERKAMLEVARARLDQAKKIYKDAMLADAEDVRAIYLLVDAPERYHKYAVAQGPVGIDRKLAMGKLVGSLLHLAHC